MTTNPADTDMSLDDIRRAADEAQSYLDQVRAARASQPERLVKARSDAEEARGWALIEEPWHSLVSAIPTYNSEGNRTGNSLTLPSITAKELFGARLAFDILDCGDDYDRIEAVQTRYFTMVGGDTGQMFLLAMSALSTIASVVVPQMLEDLEQHASNYDARPMLTDARAKAWNGRVNDESSGQVKPVDGHDIANALGAADDILSGGDEEGRREETQ